MSMLPDRPLYLVALAVGLVTMIVGAVTLTSDLSEQGVPGGGSSLTLLVGVIILVMAVTGPSDEDDGPAPGEREDG